MLHAAILFQTLQLSLHALWQCRRTACLQSLGEETVSSATPKIKRMCPKWKSFKFFCCFYSVALPHDVKGEGFIFLDWNNVSREGQCSSGKHLEALRQFPFAKFEAGFITSSCKGIHLFPNQAIYHLCVLAQCLCTAHSKIQAVILTQDVLHARYWRLLSCWNVSMHRRQKVWMRSKPQQTVLHSLK